MRRVWLVQIICILDHFFGQELWLPDLPDFLSWSDALKIYTRLDGISIVFFQNEKTSFFLYLLQTANRNSNIYYVAEKGEEEEIWFKLSVAISQPKSGENRNFSALLRTRKALRWRLSFISLSLLSSIVVCIKTFLILSEIERRCVYVCACVLSSSR